METDKKNYNSSSSLSKQVMKGGAWVFSLRAAEKIFSLVRLIILARILAPADFGLLGAAVLVIATIETFSQSGFNFALIQKKQDIKPYLNCAFSFLVLRGIALFALLFFLAPLIQAFFNISGLANVVKVAAFAVLLEGFTNIGIIYFRKELEFNKQFIYQLSGALADFIVAVTAAVILRNAWALIFGILAREFTRLIVSYIIHPYRPRFDFDRHKAKELFSFGKWVLGSSGLSFLVNQGDDFFVGKILGAMSLGFYQMAYKISNLPTTEITHVISDVILPAYSKIQDQTQRLKEAFLRVLRMIAFLSFCTAASIFVLSAAFTKLFLGLKWMPMVEVIQVLCLFGITRSINAAFGPLFYGIGKPKVLTRTAVVQLAILIITIYPLTLKAGLVGVSLAVTLCGLGGFALLFKASKSVLKITDKDIIHVFGLPFCAGISLVVLILGFNFLVKGVLPEIGVFFSSLAIALGICFFWLKKTGIIGQLKL